MTHMDDEDQLLRGLRELADADSTHGAGGAAPPTGAVLTTARRLRHRRRALGAGAATALVAAGSLLAVRWTGAAADGGPTVVADGVDRVTAPASADAPLPRNGVYPPQPRSEAGAPLDTGPRRPEADVRYRYDLSAVCDMEYAVFGGRMWKADEGQAKTRSAGDRVWGFMRWSDGFATRAEPDVAIFENDAPNPSTRTFHLLKDAEAPPACLAREPARRYSDAPAATLGPRNPQPGVRYVYDWTTACDARYLVFGGRLWKSERLLGPLALASLVGDKPMARFLTLTSDGGTAVVESRPLNAQDKRRQAEHRYHPVDQPDAGDRDRCGSALDDLQRLARDTAS
ncbi:hypothetical protein [Streptomyces sp. TRM49041]|uniref:hypothetical protein n=1 Tax=Streptomyces sp. TRM49041 TaxID=2603216 RepID=UPI0011ECBB3C|nr:hypothetical protein [Streptomyces sp. TRM49041]